MLGRAVLSTSPVAFQSHRSVFSATVPLPKGVAVLGSGSWRCGVVTSPTTWPSHVPGGTLGEGAAAEASGSGAVVSLLGTAGLPVVFVLPQTQSRSCISEGEKQQARRSSKPKRGGAGAIRKAKRVPLLQRLKRRGQRKERREEAGVLPRPHSRSTHMALSSPAPAHDPSNRSRAGGVAAPPALPNPPLPSASLPAAGTAPRGPCRPAGNPPEPPKTSGSRASPQTHPVPCPSCCYQLFNSFLPWKS